MESTWKITIIQSTNTPLKATTKTNQKLRFCFNTGEAIILSPLSCQMQHAAGDCVHLTQEQEKQKYIPEIKQGVGIWHRCCEAILSKRR